MEEATYTRPDGVPGVRMEFLDSDCIESLRVTQLAVGVVRLEESPLFSEFASYGDTIAVDVAPDGLLVCRRVVARSGLRRLSFLATEQWIETPQWRAVQQRLIAEGGMWEQIFGGIIVLHLPVDSIASFEDVLGVIREAE